MTNKKMTKKYWRSLPQDSRYRALMQVFHGNKHLCEVMSKEDNPDPHDTWWELVFRKVKNPCCDHYKTYVDGSYMP